MRPRPTKRRRPFGSQGDPEAGGRTYETCAVCHGPQGAGRADGTFPAIAGQHETVIVKQLVDMREGRRRNPVMDVHARELMDARELADVAAFVATLPAPRGNGQGAGDALEEGRRFYLRDCSGCHGQRGEGDAASFTPSLVGQHYGYLLRQVRAIAGGRRRDAHPRMAETVASYRDADLRAVVDYISRLEARWPERSGPALTLRETIRGLRMLRERAEMSYVAGRRERLALAVLLAGLLGVAGACRPSEDTAPAVAAPTEAAAPERAVEVFTDRVRRGSVLQRISAPGSLSARRESQIGPEVRGRIERIFVEDGDRVEQGEPLFQIDRASYELALHQAQARLDRARAERLKIETDLARGQKLHRQDVLAQQKLDELETGVAVAKAAEREAEEQVAMARRDLDNTVVRAPYAASVAARLADEGTTALVQPQTIVIVLQETSELEAEATIPEVHFAAIREGDPALIYVEGLGQPIATEVSSVGDSIDPATRTYLVKMVVPNADRRLKAGVFARVEILPHAKDDVLVVPLDAIRREDGRTQVLVIRDGRAAVAPVRLGVVAEDVAEVLSGVRVDEEVVVGEEASTLAPGTRIRSRGRRAAAADATRRLAAPEEPRP